MRCLDADVTQAVRQAARRRPAHHLVRQGGLPPQLPQLAEVVGDLPARRVVGVGSRGRHGRGHRLPPARRHGMRSGGLGDDNGSSARLHRPRAVCRRRRTTGFARHTPAAADICRRHPEDSLRRTPPLRDESDSFGGVGRANPSPAGRATPRKESPCSLEGDRKRLPWQVGQPRREPSQAEDFGLPRRPHLLESACREGRKGSPEQSASSLQGDCFWRNHHTGQRLAQRRVYLLVCSPGTHMLSTGNTGEPNHDQAALL